MSLKIRLKPERSVKIGQSVVKNVGAKACDLLVDSTERVERDDRDAPKKNATIGHWR